MTLRAFEIDADDLVADARRRRKAVEPSARHGHAARLGPDLDAADDRELVVLDVEHRQVVAIPVGDDTAAAVSRERDAGGLVAGLELVEHPAVFGSTSETRAGRLVGRRAGASPSAETASAIGERCGLVCEG